jgi:hypothetical protein
MSDAQSGGRCHSCGEPVIIFSKVDGRILVTTQCDSCGVETSFFLDDALKALEEEERLQKLSKH